MEKFKAGLLSVYYDKGFLRRISYGNHEVLRMVYFSLRDHNWNTLNSVIENENISIHEKGLEITYDCFNMDGGVCVMQWKGKIEGRSDGTIIFEIRGTAMEDFKKNRAGFCVLHPLNITGQECKITHPDGMQTTHLFPDAVSPENPFKDITSMAWQTSGMPFSLAFEGDVFETEDQRNWSDASFKTFCTPLSKPFPVVLKKGEKIFQRITFKPESTLQPVNNGSSHISLHKSGVSSIMPALGIAASTEMNSIPLHAVSLLRSLNLSHYRIEIFPAKDNWVARFSNDYENGYALGLPLEIALHLSRNYKEETEAFVMLCQQNKVKVRKVLLLNDPGMVTTQGIIEQVTALKDALPKVQFGGGTNYNFNEINKNHFTPHALDFISFSIDPQEHAFDNLTILENLEAQEHLVNSAKSIYGNSMPVHISPITLRKRCNPYAANPRDHFIEESRKADPRQKEVFGAVWTFGSICSLAKGGARAITYYQTIGNQGILSEQADPYPVYGILKNFSRFQGKRVNILESSDSLAVQGILLEDKLLGLVNLTEQEQTVYVDGTLFTLGPQEIKFEPLHGT